MYRGKKASKCTNSANLLVTEKTQESALSQETRDVGCKGMVRAGVLKVNVMILADIGCE